MESTLTGALKAEAVRLGFDRVGVAPAVNAPDFSRFLDWLGDGHAAGMDYLARHAGLRENPSRLLEGARSDSGAPSTGCAASSSGHSATRRRTPLAATSRDSSPFMRVARYTGASQIDEVIAPPPDVSSKTCH